MRVAINLLTDHPDHPSGAHWSLTRTIEKMVTLLEPDEELYLITSPRSRPLHEGYGPRAHHITYPWSNERRWLRTLSEHVLSPVRLPLSRIDVLDTLLAPVIRSTPSLVAHFRTMHAYAEPGSISPAVRYYRQLSYPRTARTADAIIINSESLRTEIERYLDVDPAKLRLVPEAVDHDLFTPGDPEEAARHLGRFGVRRPFVLFVSSLWPYKNAAGLLRAFALARAQLNGHQLAMVGPDRDAAHGAELRALANELAISDDVVWVGGVHLTETVHFYRAADVFVYPSLNETFGLPLLEAMACACPVVTSSVSSMPEVAGEAALLVDPQDPVAMADAIVAACGPEGKRLRDLGVERAGQYTWEATARGTLETYREVHRAR